MWVKYTMIKIIDCSFEWKAMRKFKTNDGSTPFRNKMNIYLSHTSIQILFDKIK